MKSKGLLLAAETARLYGICDENALRNRTIQLEFDEMKISLPDTPVDTLMIKLSEKYFLSPARIRNICYPDTIEEKAAINNTKELETMVTPQKTSIKKPTRRIYPRRT